MTTGPLRMIAALSLLVALVVLPSCSRALSTEPLAPSSTTQSEGSHNDADVSFARNMLTHVKQSAELAGIAGTNTANHELIVLANQLTSEQQADRQAYSAWLLQWGEDPHAENATAGTVPGAVDAATLTTLRTSTGPGFDKLWLDNMITHEQGVVIMAQTELARGQNQDITTLARLRMGTQRIFIDRMKYMLTR